MLKKAAEGGLWPWWKMEVRNAQIKAVVVEIHPPKQCTKAREVARNSGEVPGSIHAELRTETRAEFKGLYKICPI